MGVGPEGYGEGDVTICYTVMVSLVVSPLLCLFTLRNSFNSV